MSRSKCRSCGAAILWVVTEQGNAQPLDAEPEKRVILVGERSYQTERGLRIERLAQVVDAYMPHHATCPDADQWRKSRK